MHETALYVPLWLMLLTTVVGGLEGALRGTREGGFDVVGMFALAVCLGLGGGIIRDVLLGATPPVALASPWYIVAVAGATLLVFLVRSLSPRIRSGILLIDAVCVGLWAVVGTEKAIAFNMPTVVTLLLGMVTAVGGGVLVDLLLGKKPMILGPGPLYATAAFVGALLFWFLREHTAVHVAVAATISVVISLAIRLVAIRYKVLAPTPEDTARWLASKFRRSGSDSA
jgi:uncharacterized membrane protein YeiH